ncbi:3-oxoacyl synthase [Acrasis kona]|uniref:3-oxoacyl synthase n=1 Tax=Acrasis kona TaxID=1008807 RepID=A0AAW2YZB3_9EUKA
MSTKHNGTGIGGSFVDELMELDLDKNRIQSPESIIKYLLDLYPAKESVDDLRGVLKLMDDESSVDLSQLQDKKVKFLLAALFSPDYNIPNWSKHVHRSKSSRHPLKFKKKSKASGFSFLDFFDDKIKLKDSQTQDYVPTVEEKMKKLVDEYNRTHRPRSLVEEHLLLKNKKRKSHDSDSSGDERKRKKDKKNKKSKKNKYNSSSEDSGLDERSRERKKAEREERESKKLAQRGYLTFDREKVMGSERPIDPNNLKNIIQNAANLNSRFNSRVQTSHM